MKQVILLMGLPRSGKSTLARQLHTELGYPVINPDDVRTSLHGEAFLPRAERMVWSMAYYFANALLLGPHEGLIVDACNRMRKRRDEWRYELKGDLHFKVAEVVTEKDMCLARAAGNEQLQTIIERMAAGYEPLADDEELYDRFTF